MLSKQRIREIETLTHRRFHLGTMRLVERVQFSIEKLTYGPRAARSFSFVARIDSRATRHSSSPQARRS